MRIFVVTGDPRSKAAFVIIAGASTLDVKTIDTLDTIRRVAIIVDTITALTRHPTTIAAGPASQITTCVTAIAVAITYLSIAVAITRLSIAITRLPIAVAIPSACKTGEAG